MAKQVGSAESVYKLVEVIGTSTKSWDDAAKNAVRPHQRHASRRLFQNTGNPDEQVCDNVAAIHFVKHFVPSAGVEIVSD